MSSPGELVFKGCFHWSHFLQLDGTCLKIIQVIFQEGIAWIVNFAVFFFWRVKQLLNPFRTSISYNQIIDKLGEMSMEYRLHKNFEISEIGVGCYSLGGVYGEKDVGEFKRMLVRAYGLGVNFFDTAGI